MSFSSQRDASYSNSKSVYKTAGLPDMPPVYSEVIPNHQVLCTLGKGEELCHILHHPPLESSVRLALILRILDEIKTNASQNFNVQKNT